MDGFPALVSDPWLNGRLTALHACSDLWACGAAVSSAMAAITLPMVSANEQQELLVQTLAGIRSVLDEQGAELIGGHDGVAKCCSGTGLPWGADRPYGERQQQIALAQIRACGPVMPC